MQTAAASAFANADAVFGEADKAFTSSTSRSTRPAAIKSDGASDSDSEVEDDVDISLVEDEVDIFPAKK